MKLWPESFFVKTLRFRCVSCTILWEQKKKKKAWKMRERKRTQLGSWRDCESQARKRSRNKSCMAEIEEEFEICPQNALLSPRSKIQRCVVPSISLVLETAWAERAFVCVLVHMCTNVCLRCPCDPCLDSRAHTRTGAHTQPFSLCWWEHVSARRYRPIGAGSPKHVHSTLKTLKVCCEGAHA